MKKNGFIKKTLNFLKEYWPLILMLFIIYLLAILANPNLYNK